MERLGYESHYKVLNAKNYGVPQNRERVFTVSILGGGDFEFPEPKPQGKRLKDVLEEKVDEKYYLSEKTVAGFIKHNKTHESRGNGFKFEPIDTNKPAHTISTKAGGRPTDNFVKESMSKQVCNRAISEGFVKPNDVIEYTYSKAHMEEMDAGKIKTQNSQHNDCFSTLKTNADKLGICVASRVRKTMPNYRIRKLTPLECWRLMGFGDSDFYKAEKVVSATQLYKQAGNSIVVDVLMAIFNNLKTKNVVK